MNFSDVKKLTIEAVDVKKIEINGVVVWEEPASYTNQVPISIDTDGSIYNTKGYKLDIRLNSSGLEKTQLGCISTGFIPIKNGNILRVKNFANGKKSNFASTGNAINLYDSSYNLLTKNQEGTGSYILSGNKGSMNDTTGIYTVNVSDILDNENIAFVRVSTLVATLGINANDADASKIIVTVNEEIE